MTNMTFCITAIRELEKNVDPWMAMMASGHRRLDDDAISFCNADGIASWASTYHAQMKKKHVRLAIGRAGKGSVWELKKIK